MKKEAYFADHLEAMVAAALTDNGIEFIHESQNKDQGLDFFLPLFDVYIEIKQYHSERISRQMASQNNVIALQGTKAVNFFIEVLKK
jgi:hypothetical protein